MTHVSRKRLSRHLLKEILDSLVVVLTETKNNEQMRSFLDAFLTKTEKLMLAKRIAIVYLLSERVGELEIARILGVTQATVSRTKLWAETKGTGYKIAIVQIKKQKMLESLKKLAIKFVSYSIRASAGHV